MTPDHGQLIYEGKAKRIYRCDLPDRVFIEFKNDATAFNALKRAELAGKGRINCQISASLFEMLQSKGVLTHYVGVAAENWMVAQSVDVIPLEVVVRNIATGSLCKQTPINHGMEIFPPLLDFYYKDDSLGDPLLTKARLRLLDLIEESQLKEIEKQATLINDLLRVFFDSLDLILVDFKLEFGFNDQGKLLLADEISPDTCRIWDKTNNHPQDRILDKDRFRKDLGEVVESYEEILKRVQGVTSKPRNYK